MIKFRGFLDFRTVKDKILFLDSKTTPRTFNALEAKLGTKNKRYNEVAIEATTS